MLKGLRIDEGRLNRLESRRRDRVVAALRVLDAKREHTPLDLYFPHAKQHVLHQFSAPVRCFFGGTQSGKTTGGLADDLIQALPAEALPEHLRAYKVHSGPFFCRIMSETYGVLETVILQKLREMVPAVALEGQSWKSAFDQATQVLRFANGSLFQFKTYQQDVGGMGGVTFDRVHYDEEPPEPHRTEGRFRVMAREGHELFTMTPTEGLSWTYDPFWKHQEEELLSSGVHHGSELEIVLVDMDDNPALSEKAKTIALAGLSKEERQARKEGRFVALHGLIFAEFRRDRHILPEIDATPEDPETPGRYTIPRNCNVFVGIDPGIRGKAAVIWIYLRADDVMVAFSEGYFEGMTVREVAAEIHAANASYGITPNYYVIDPSARNKEHQTGRSDQMEYMDHGIVSLAAQNAVPAGINRIKERLETDRLLISDACPNLVEEMLKYRWREPPRSGEDAPAKPVKKDDHLLDSLRYVCMSRPYAPEEIVPNDETPDERMMREDFERSVGEKVEAF